MFGQQSEDVKFCRVSPRAGAKDSEAARKAITSEPRAGIRRSSNVSVVMASSARRSIESRHLRLVAAMFEVCIRDPYLLGRQLPMGAVSIKCTGKVSTKPGP